MWKYEETGNFVFFTWPKNSYISLEKHVLYGFNDFPGLTQWTQKGIGCIYVGHNETFLERTIKCYGQNQKAGRWISILLFVFYLSCWAIYLSMIFFNWHGAIAIIISWILRHFHKINSIWLFSREDFWFR